MDGFHPHFCFDVFVGGIWNFLKIGDVWSLEFPPFFGLEKVNKKLVDIHDHPCLIFNGDKLRCHWISATFLFCFHTLEVVATFGEPFG